MFFGDGVHETHRLKACFFMRLPSTSVIEPCTGATFHSPEDGDPNKKEGFVFVRSDGAGLLVCPQRDNLSMKAYWLKPPLLSALAADRFFCRDDDNDGMPRSWASRTFEAIDEMDIPPTKLPHFKLAHQKLHILRDWDTNHGTPWGEGPAISHWPKTQHGNKSPKRISVQSRWMKEENYKNWSGKY